MITISRLLFLSLTVGLAGAASQAWADTKVLPGYWESTNTYSLLLSTTKITRKCLTLEEVDKYITRPEIKHYNCNYNSRQIGGGKVKLGGACVDSKGQSFAISITGSYTPEHFHLVANSHYPLGGIALPISADIDAHRLSAECPADAPPGR